MFKKVVQVGIVVKSVEATAKRYWEDLAIGPWRFYTLDPSNTTQLTLRGKPTPHAFRVAIADLGGVELELIEPLEGNNLYSEHLAEHGEGLHHIQLEAEDFAQAKELLRDRGFEQLQSGRPFGASNYVYFDTQEKLGCIIESGCWLTEEKSLPPPEATLP